MKYSLRRTIGAGAAALILLTAGAQLADLAAQDAGRTQRARSNPRAAPAPPPPAATKPQKLPPRIPFTAADEAVAAVPGMSTGALMAPFVFAGPRYDAALAAVYTHTSAADIFEVGGTGESFLDTWPLKDLIAKQITPALLTDI